MLSVLKSGIFSYEGQIYL